MTSNDWVWWQHGVVYQIYPRSFGDSNGDGIGDLAGILAHLDYLSATLGVEAVWLSPFYPSPMADFGYDVANYTDVDPLFGDLHTFDRLVRELHAHDIRIIIDFVPNHTSDRHPWFLESRSSRENPRRDWYIWRDPRPDGSPPNNWQGQFGGGAWEWDQATGQYYLHSFLAQQPDLNWRNHEVRAAMFDVLRFWLDRGVDGFRIDVAPMVMKDPDLRDNPPNPAYDPRRDRPFDAFLHTMDRAHPDIHPLYREIRRLLDSYSAERPRVMIGEIHEYDWPVWASYYGTHLDEFNLPFNFGLVHTPWGAAAVREVVGAIEDALRQSGGWPNYVLGNHDEHRIATRAGAASAPLAMMLLLTLRGTPTMYYGDELGMHDVPIPPEAVQDPFERMTPGRGLGRDPERTPMQWSAAPNAGFCPPNVAPWLPVASDAGRINAEVERHDPRSMLALTRALLSLRRAIPALHRGAHQPLDGIPDEVVAFVRHHQGDRLLTALNFAPEARSLLTSSPPIRFPDGLPERGTVLLSTRLDRTGMEELRGFTLRPHEGCVIQLSPASE